MQPDSNSFTPLAVLGASALLFASADAQCVSQQLCRDALTFDRTSDDVAVFGNRLMVAGRVAEEGATDIIAWVYEGLDDPAPVDIRISVDSFGASSDDLDGDVAVLGLTLGGAAIVERASDGGWNQALLLEDSYAASTAIVATDSGRVIYSPGDAELSVFEKVGATWTQVAAVDTQMLPVAADIDGDRLVAYGLRNFQQVLATYTLSGAGWVLEQEFAFSELAPEPGDPVLLDGERIFAGLTSTLRPADNRVACFENGASGWLLTEELLPPLGSEPLGVFGADLAVDGSRLAVGAPNQVGVVSGTLWTYLQVSGSWLINGSQRLTDGQASARLGESLAYHPAGLIAGVRGRRCFDQGRGAVVAFAGNPCDFSVNPNPEGIPVAPIDESQAVFLTGSQLLNVRAIRIDGVPVSSQLLAEDVLRVSADKHEVGTFAIELEGVLSTQFVDVEVEYAEGPILMTTYADPFFNTTFSATVFGMPGDLAVVLASSSMQPSSIPGLLDLKLGDAFMQLYSIAEAPFPANETGGAQVEVTFDLPNPQVFFVQAISLDAGGINGPIETSDRVSFIYGPE